MDAAIQIRYFCVKLWAVRRSGSGLQTEIKGRNSAMRHRTIGAAICVFLLGVTLASVEVRREINFPDLPGYVTLECDLHMHTVFSDGLVWPTVRVEEAWREGLDAIAITDHIEYQPHKDDIPTNHNRPFEIASHLARKKNILLIQGAEITRDTPPGHFNAIFLADIKPLDTPDFFDVFEAAARQQAFVFWNHPGWKGPERGRWGDEHTRLFERGQLHGIEICNGDEYYDYAHREALDRNLTLLGNSDIHDPSLGREWTATEHRTLTLVFAKDRTVEALREGLLQRRTAVWCQNRLIGREEHLQPLFDECLDIRPPHRSTDGTVRVEIENLCELDIELESVGEVQPVRLTLPARATSQVRFRASADALKKGLPYRALNFIPAAGNTLPVTLRVSPVEADAAGAGRR